VRVLKILAGTLISTAVLLAALHLYVGYRRARGFDPAAFRAAAAGYNAEIVRDRWGVPHVFGRRDADVAFGLAYAHAEDDIESYEALLPLYRAEQGRTQGRAGATGDYLVQLLGVREAVEEEYESALSADTRSLLSGYAAGINYFAAGHPERVNRALYPVWPQDLVVGFSFQHLFFYGFQDELERLLSPLPPDVDRRDVGAVFGPADPPRGSNAFAVAPWRSADGATRVVINSHQPLTGPVAWYEAHLVSEAGWNATGGLFPGMPLIAVGATPDTAWGATVNKPDLVDVYRLEIDPEDPTRYRLDGEWRRLESRAARLPIKLLGTLYWPFERQLLSSKHGPVLRTDDGVFALRFAGHREIRQVEQWYRLNKARDLDTFKEAMRLQALASLNFVYGDRSGNIFFVHNSASPRRPPGPDWQAVLPGDDSHWIWTETVGFDDLPQVENPASGWLVSANQTPFRVSADGDNPDAAAFATELGLQARMTNRAWRGLELFADLTSGEPGTISLDQLEAIKYDHRYSPDSRSYRWLAGLGPELRRRQQRRGAGRLRDDRRMGRRTEGPGTGTRRDGLPLLCQPLEAHARPLGSTLGRGQPTRARRDELAPQRRPRHSARGLRARPGG
jgi:penicillin amidase/acyl-homoserine-lactone acylase